MNDDEAKQTSATAVAENIEIITMEEDFPDDFACYAAEISVI